MNTTKRLFSALALFLCLTFALQAQTSELPESYAAAGLFYNTYAVPHVTGFGAYAKKIAASTYSYTNIDVTSNSLKNFKPETTTTTGIAQQLTTFGGFGVFGMVTAGVAVANSSTGANLGFAGSGGFLLVKPISKGWTVDIPIRVLASTVGPPQYVVGIGVGWGK
jgi:hypothetical protein